MTAVYVGWTGRGNLGDDAIAEALLHHIPDVASWHVPTDPTAFAGRLLAGAGVGARRRSVLLGGGTVVGRRNWRLLLTATPFTFPDHVSTLKPFSANVRNVTAIIDDSPVLMCAEDGEQHARQDHHRALPHQER